MFGRSLVLFTMIILLKTPAKQFEVADLTLNHGLIKAAESVY